VDVFEDGDNYVVETELVGVKRDMEFRVGGGGRSVTIEGKIMQRGT
jgi:HSP20 family molecular chaperone IbpA